MGDNTAARNGAGYQSTENTALLCGNNLGNREESAIVDKRRLTSSLSVDDGTSSGATDGTSSLGNTPPPSPPCATCSDRKPAEEARGSRGGILALVLLAAAIFMVGEYVGERRERQASRFPPTRKWNVRSGDGGVIPIEKAQEAMLDVGNGLSLWYRTWGNRESGIPVLFVHGGPGNAVSDYHNMNANFFPADKYFVIEADQRGTGRSQPSVWDDISNSRFYEDLTIGMMSHDFETLRTELGVDRWLVFGGSWGSTLGLDYTLRYPRRCLGAILRGVFLDSRSEFDAIYRRASFEGNGRLLAEFDAFLEPARREALASGEEDVDPDDAERIVRLYQRLVWRGDRDAIWRWYVFEVNIMEEDPAERREYDVVVEGEFPEAGSVAFFESRLFLHGLFEEPMNLLRRVRTNSHRIRTAFEESELPEDREGNGPAPLNYWICQGRRDEICPMRYAEKLVGALEEADIPIQAHFVDGGHQASSPAVAQCLTDRVKDFAAYFEKNLSGEAAKGSS